jgi:hypothetical protein
MFSGKLGKDGAGMSQRTKPAIACCVLLAAAYFIFAPREESEQRKKLDAHLRAAWATCRGIYPEAKGDPFADCVSGLMLPYILSTGK